eukprot:gi/632970914/ref/XP_007901910.1/ PREDICTED: uncharacterized protein LOC103185300 [Callorhinchus milii]
MESHTDFKALQAIFQTAEATPQSKPRSLPVWPDPVLSGQPPPDSGLVGDSAQPRAAGIKDNPAFAIFQKPSRKPPPATRGGGKPPNTALRQSGDGAEKSFPPQAGGEQDSGGQERDVRPGDGGDGGDEITFKEKLRVWEKTTWNSEDVKGPSGKKPKGNYFGAPHLSETGSSKTSSPRAVQRELPSIISLGQPPSKPLRPQRVDLSHFQRNSLQTEQEAERPRVTRSSAPLGYEVILAKSETKFQGQNHEFGEWQRDQSKGQQEKREKDLRRFNLTGRETPIFQARDQGKQDGRKNQQSVKHDGYTQREEVKLDVREIREVSERLSRQSLSSEEIYDDVALTET